MEPENDKSLSSRIEIDKTGIREVEVPDTDNASIHQVEVPPWNEAYEISSTDEASEGTSFHLFTVNTYGCCLQTDSLLKR